MKKWFVVIITLLALSAMGQQAYMRLDNHKLRIGEQTVLHLFFDYNNPNEDALIIWPEFDETITDHVEIVDKTIDKEIITDSALGTYQREQKLLITVFEPGTYRIPSQTIFLNDSAFTTEEDSILVETVEVDTTKGIADIKPIYSVNYPFSERSKDWFKKYWYYLTAGALALIGFLFWRKYKKKEEDTEPEVLEEIIPAHVLALTTLEKLLREEKWKSGEKKVYYSELTDTVRAYLENRFGIHAMEKTTREIIKELKYSAITEDDEATLRKILREADMVKFAKFTPGDEDAYHCLNKSIDFVNRTKKKETGNGN